MPEQTALQKALVQACQFAEAHGVDDLVPADFAIQRSPAGYTHVTYVGPDAVIVAVIRTGENPVFGMAEPDWVHYPDTTDNAPCDECASPPPMTTVYLPGDGPTENGDTE